MTKYILHGGETSRPFEDNKEFFFEMVKGLLDPVKVLCVYFPRNKEDWDKLFDQDKEGFSSALPTKVLEFTRAEGDPKIFKKQLQKADVVYMRGGNTDKLIEGLKPIENSSELIQGKVVSGSSAGACALSMYFHTGTAGSKVRDRLGILEIKTFVHYSEEKLKDLQDLENRGKKMPIYKIPEEKFFIIEQ